jgi:hypothetical protein
MTNTKSEFTFGVEKPFAHRGLWTKIDGSRLIVQHVSGEELIVLVATPGKEYMCAIIGKIGWVYVKPTDCTPLRRTSEYRNEIFRPNRIPKQ